MKPDFGILGATPVEFAAVAGREKQRWYARQMKTIQERDGFGLGERETLPLFDRGCMVANTNYMEGEVLPHPQR
jgi:hypothetical protein